MNITIRQSNIGDSEGLAELYLLTRMHHRDLDEVTLDLEDYEKKARKDVKDLFKDGEKYVIVAEIGSELIGFGFFSKVYKEIYKEPWQGYINKAYVKDKYRSKGVFKMIYEKGLEWFKSQGLKYIELSCYSNNLESLNTWKSLGFEEIRKTMRRKI